MPIEVVPRDAQTNTLTSNGRRTVVVVDSGRAKDFEGRSRLFARVHNGRTWGAPTPLHRPPAEVGWNGAAFNADGSLRVVFFENEGIGVTRTLEPDGTWGPRTGIGRRLGTGGNPLSVAVWGDRRAGVLSGSFDGVRFFERTD